MENTVVKLLHDYCKKMKVIALAEITLLEKSIDQEDCSKTRRILETKKSDLEQFWNISVEVRLGDFLFELFRLTGLNYDDVNIYMATGISFFGIHNKEELFSLIWNGNSNDKIKEFEKEIRFKLNSSVLNLSMTMPFNLLTKQANSGKRLIEHCNAIVKCDTSWKSYTELVVGNDVEDVICIFKLKDLINDDKNQCSNVSLFRQVIINCSQYSIDNNRGTCRIRKQ